MPEPSAFDPSTFRKVLSHYPTGVTVITAVDANGQPAGMVVGTFTSVSLDPPLVAFMPDKASTSWPRIESAGSFCANVLSQHQQSVCQQFARSGGDKFSGIEWRAALSGAPILDDVVAWVDCTIEQVMASGDHYIVIGRVQALEVMSGDLPLTFVQGGYGKVALTLDALTEHREPRNYAEPAQAGWKTPGNPGDEAHAQALIIHEVLSKYLSELLTSFRQASSSGRGKDRLAALIGATFDSIEHNRGGAILFQTERSRLPRAESADIAELEESLQRVWIDALREGVDSAELRADLKPRLVYRFIRDATFVAARWFREDGEMTLAQLAEEYTSLVLDGLRTRAR
jgi:flavin reductase (DIM6/NTAB) family NADH-FMN oxidoreductase RutF